MVVDREVIVLATVVAVPNSGEWAETLALTQRLDGFKVYRRDLPAIRSAVEGVSRALGRPDW